eukprot:Pompholyxophrys_punicea_v1_NODE_15_length_6209_cov_7.334416.p4 type:complete len:142 gc:universal NODE_15_length_6209_cov_7.334416:2847-3272(+)
MNSNLLPAFNPDNPDAWMEYEERFSAYCRLHKLKPDSQEAVDTLTLSIGERTYSLLRAQTIPQKLSDMELEELLQILRNQFKTTKQFLMERVKFNQLVQGDGESITNFATRIKKTSTDCEFGQFMKEAWRDRLLLGCDQKK